MAILSNRALHEVDVLLRDGQDIVSFGRDALYQETDCTQASGLLQTMKYDPAGRLIEQKLGAVNRGAGSVPTFQHRHISR